MTCNFDPNKCSPECRKFHICSYYSIQSQLSNIQSQLTFMYKTISEILNSDAETNLKLNLLEEALRKISEGNDSDAIE